MDHEEQRLRLMMEAAEALMSVAAASTKDLLDGLADRPRPGAKKRAREALVGHLRAIGEFRAAVSRARGVAIEGSATASVISSLGVSTDDWHVVVDNGTIILTSVADSNVEIFGSDGHWSMDGDIIVRTRSLAKALEVANLQVASAPAL